MIRWTGKYALWSGIALILGVNAIVLAGVAYNRSGVPQAILTLTENELPMLSNYGLDNENSGIKVTLKWRIKLAENGLSLQGYADWLTKEKLVSLGFDVNQPPPPPERIGWMMWSHQSNKSVYLVLEQDGPAHHSVVAELEKKYRMEKGFLERDPENGRFKRDVEWAERRYLEQKNSEQRLYVIDAGLDNDALRAQYPEDNYFILKGSVRMGYRKTRSADDPILTGFIGSIPIKAVYIPGEYRGIFTEISKKNYRRDKTQGPRYQITLAIGKRNEPWVMGVRRLE